MDPVLLADVIVATHLAIVLFVLAGQLCVLIGWPLRWAWIRRPLFRFAHAVVIAIVVAQAAVGKDCFLTVWERDLRASAGERTESISFVGRLARDVLFVDVPQRELDKIYFGFGGLVLLSWVFCPPRRRRREADAGDARS